MFRWTSKALKAASYLIRYKEPDAVPALTKHEIYALQKLYEGEANAYEQRLSINVIISKFCLRNEPKCILDPYGSVFRDGRSFVGSLIVQTLKITEPFQGLPTTEDEESHEAE